MKIKNDYAISIEFFDKCPKAVFAALAMSLALMHTNENFEKAEKLLLDEWEMLYEQGIVPQKPKNT